MQLTIKVKPGSSRESLTSENGELVLRVRERAIEGAANAACIAFLAKEFDVPKSRVRLVHGETSRVKRFEIEGIG